MGYAEYLSPREALVERALLPLVRRCLRVMEDFEREVGRRMGKSRKSGSCRSPLWSTYAREGDSGLEEEVVDDVYVGSIKREMSAAREEGEY